MGHKSVRMKSQTANRAGPKGQAEAGREFCRRFALLPQADGKAGVMVPAVCTAGAARAALTARRQRLLLRWRQQGSGWWGLV